MTNRRRNLIISYLLVSYILAIRSWFGDAMSSSEHPHNVYSLQSLVFFVLSPISYPFWLLASILTISFNFFLSANFDTFIKYFGSPIRIFIVCMVFVGLWSGIYFLIAKLGKKMYLFMVLSVGILCLYSAFDRYQWVKGMSGKVKISKVYEYNTKFSTLRVHGYFPNKEFEYQIEDDQIHYRYTPTDFPPIWPLYRSLKSNYIPKELER